MTMTPVHPRTETSSDETLAFSEAARARRSIRGFLDKPVPLSIIREVLEDAQCAPSNCNTQPWNTHIVRGEKLKQLSKILHAKNDAGEFTPDFSFDQNDYYGEYRKRNDALGKAYYEAMNVMREDKEGRRRVGAMNYSFFNAPQVAFLFMPSFGDNVRVAGDIGMYGQTFLLSLAARGLGGIPQTALGFFAQTIREFLGIPDELKLLFGISFGYPDEAAPGNRIHMDRVPVDTSVTFHD
ncbi:nitroreductase [Chimaeribacter arupi]|uniref:Nitroreductase n=1 Tax=Chimaeribacter arupi TaxID=2060066 RepID=A0A2N5EKM2_9GAMM|nr:nitroreductase [Chimaeribacter arupi]MDV5139849.1 nitroreductase [Chimaeribacter arupi]PLR46895.1 nitroreductase [Chimaeribacter arupi]PLR47079.1 nitroreductase [Chimaeribacter arupi]WKZ94514.1 nitroreductase [Chimaeribacter arupi]